MFVLAPRPKAASAVASTADARTTARSLSSIPVRFSSIQEPCRYFQREVMGNLWKIDILNSAIFDASLCFQLTIYNIVFCETDGSFVDVLFCCNRPVRQLPTNQSSFPEGYLPCNFSAFWSIWVTSGWWFWYVLVTFVNFHTLMI